MKSRAPSGVDFIRYGVSTSIKSILFKYFLVSNESLFLNKRLFFISSLLISKYLYFILSSSPPSVSFSIVNGGVLDLFKIFN